jgi:hypothetical protein
MYKTGGTDLCLGIYVQGSGLKRMVQLQASNIPSERKD